MSKEGAGVDDRVLAWYKQDPRFYPSTADTHKT